MGKKVFLRWTDLEVSVPPPPPSLKERLFGRPQAGSDAESNAAMEPPTGRTILNKVNGIARPGDLIALMGSSGAGKTTLLNTLSRRNIGNLKVTGNIKVNGKMADKTIGSVSAYVQQEDLFLVTLTVREHLRFQATLRMSADIPLAKRYERVEEVINELGLQSCANSKIGNNRTVQGISGGERKRLSFASEILEDPPLLFADEPTSGLDSFKAMTVVQALQDLAAKGHTIICTIHQPPSEVFAMFNRLMLLAEGRVAYIGVMQDAVSHFASLGYTCPPHYNPADFFVFTLAIVPGKEEESKERVKKINDVFSQVEEELRRAERKSFRMPGKGANAPDGGDDGNETPSAADTDGYDGEDAAAANPPTLTLTAVKPKRRSTSVASTDDGKSTMNEVEYTDDIEQSQQGAKAKALEGVQKDAPKNEQMDAPEEAGDIELEEMGVSQAELVDADCKPLTPNVQPRMSVTMSTTSAESLYTSSLPTETAWVQTKALLWRSWVTTVREPLIVQVRFSQTVFLGLLCGLIFLQLENDAMRIQNVAGALFFIVVQMTFGTVFPTVQLIPVEIPVFLREHSNRMYRTTIYLTTKTIAALPFNIALPVIFTTLAYWMIGLNQGVDRFFICIAIIILTTFSAEAYGYLISSFSKNEQVALAITPPMVVPLMLFGGLFLNSESTPDYFVWVEKVSFIKYAFHAVMINEFEGAETAPCPVLNGTVGSNCFPNGDAVLRFYGMNKDELNLSIGVLFALGVVMKILANLVIMYRVRRN